MTSGGNKFIDFPHQGCQLESLVVYTPYRGLHQSHIRGCQLEPGGLHPLGGLHKSVTMGHVNRLICLFTVQLSVAPLTIKSKIVFNNILHSWIAGCICGVKLSDELCQDVELN